MVTSIGKLLHKGALRDEIEDSKEEIFSLYINGKKVWIKKARAKGISKLHKFFYKIAPLDILSPGERMGSKEALRYEVEKISRLKKKGINVPNILHVEDSFFIMEDLGENLHEILREEESLSATCRYIDLSMGELCKIHSLGEYHGGSQTRNFAYKKDKIYILDFEENFSQDINIDTLKFRDLLLYLLSFTKIKDKDINYNYIIDRYISLTGNKTIKDKLLSLAKKTTLISKVGEIKFINKYLGSDLRNFISLVSTISKKENNICPKATKQE